MVTPTIPITMTQPPENTPTLLTILMVLLWTTVPQPDIGHPPGRLEAYQEGQQA
jgi:hypothetical protein